MKDNIEHIKLNREKWDKWAGSYDNSDWRVSLLRKAQQYLVSILQIKNDVHFLDVGCGTGFAVEEVARSVNFSGEFYGVDLSQKMIDKAKINFSSSKNIHFIRADAESMPLYKNYFDIIICTNSFHHYLHPIRVLEMMHDLLRKDGKVYILDPTVDNWHGRVMNKILKIFEPEHVNFYSTDEFKQMFENVNLKYIDSKNLNMNPKNIKTELFNVGRYKVHVATLN